MTLYSLGSAVTSFNISILNDGIPEIDEDFTVEMMTSSGDTVLSEKRSGVVVIAANDDPYGVFQFSPMSMSANVIEGNMHTLM